MKEFMGIAQATAVGFLVMGFVGFFVKLIHIPINNVLGEDTHMHGPPAFALLCDENDGASGKRVCIVEY